MGRVAEEELKIWTVGHSTREIGEFLDLLAANGIEALADVRSLPGSRKFPQFNAEVLSGSLADVGIEYHAFKDDLGGRRRARSDSTNTVWRNASFRGYADHMETGEFKKGIERLLKLARKRRTAIMCAEAVWWRCHRSMISDYVKATGIEVEHIMDGTNATHPFTSAAQIKGGKLVYGPAA